MALVIDTSPTLTPVTLDEVKDRLRVTHTDEDELIANIIKGATKWAENYTGWRFCEQTWMYYPEKFPSDWMVIPYPPVSSVTYVKYYNGSNVLTTLTEDTDYRVDTYSRPGVLEPIDSWPGIYDRVNPIQIKFVCGYSSVDDIEEDIKDAIHLRVADLYENRQETYVGNASFRVERNTVTAMALLDSYKLQNRTW